MSQAILEVRDLMKYFKTPKGMLHAVDGVSFSLDRAKTIGIVGESGCGKSTLGRCIVRLLDPTGGSIFFDGQDVTAADRRRQHELHKDMQMIFQDPYSSLNPRQTVSETIAEPLRRFKLCPDKGGLSKRVDRLMETVGLAQRFVNSYPHELDGGRRQRIGIARALAVEPRFIVCDEPVSALDVSIQAQILNLMMDLQDELGIAYLFITHNLSVVKHISDDIGVMYLGQLVEKCPSGELFQNPCHPYTQALLSAIPIAKSSARRERIILRGEITSPIDPPPGCRFAPRCNHACDRCLAPVPLREVSDGHFVACTRFL